MTYENLLGGPAATYLPGDEEASSALRAAADPASVAARFPASCDAWAALAQRALVEKLSRADIKKAIRTWRPDYWRV